jgi:hypothetical protein
MIFESKMPEQLEDALYALAVTDEQINAGQVDELARQYPEYAAQITEFVVALVLDDAKEKSPFTAAEMEETSPVVSRAMSRFHNELYKLGAIQTAPETKGTTVTFNPFAVLSRKELRAVAAGLNVSMTFVLKMRDRLIDLSTMSEGFKTYVADRARVPIEQLRAHFAGDPIVATTASYKADIKPAAVNKQSFNDAVQSSDLTPEQQAFLLGL